jgi:hypothetical protein
MWYSFDSSASTNLIPITVERVMEIIRLNKQGIIVEKLTDVDLSKVVEEVGYTNAAGQESLTRFDDKKKPQRRPQPQQQVKPQVQQQVQPSPENRPKIKVVKKT